MDIDNEIIKQARWLLYKGAMNDLKFEMTAAQDKRMPLWRAVDS